ncbi:polysaccharide biosynthesis protein [Formosa agariphila KMM 3901]|uniref:Polysaccharide biosynthesis protein n=1 Tax=Formosa agariphila (strain DSM 15362 / KCTC 12365 / LMG 23005 / KMM 3901 / M-2Alg 35-1) TaxID=1347342 RepID=T2KNH8_FORAG|nr:flippase [Formosa agariphila]CDF79991.1 polysaccharide biosynthesis protein [Formosa agariphila KMM 3901]
MDQLKLYYQKFKIYITNSIWVVLSLVIRTLITIFIVSKIAKLLGATEFGWYNLGISIFTILYSFSTLGFGYSFLIKYLSNKNYNKEEIIGTALLSRLVVSSLIIILLSSYIFFYQTDSHYWAVVIASLSIIFQSSEVITTYFQYKMKANIYVPITLVTLIIESVLLIAGIYYELGLIYFITIYSLERLFILIGLLIFLNFEIKLKSLSFDKRLLRKLLIQSWPLLLGALLTAIYARFDQVLIKHFLTAYDLGLYGTSIILSQIWYVIPSLIIPIIFPKIADLKTQTNKKKYYDLIFTLYGILNYLAMGIIVFIYIFGKYIILYLYGIEYIESFDILKILCLNLIISFQSNLTTNLMIVENEENYLFKIKFIGVISNILLNILFLSTMGVKFAAYSLILSSFLSWILMSVFNKKMLELLKLNLKSYLIPLHYKQVLTSFK